MIGRGNMKLTRFIGYIVLSFWAFQTLNAQNIIKVKGAQGRWEVYGETTLQQAEDRAFLEAKKDALRKAGVMENVWSVFGQISQDNGEEFHEAYSQMSVLAIGGMVGITNKKVENYWNPDERRLYKVVTIDATVKKADEADSSYALEASGIENVYKEGEKFHCNLKVYGSDSYLKFFWFDESGGALLYPNLYEKSMLFNKGQEYAFPMSLNLDYQMEKKNKKADNEKVNIMIVATKTEIPYIGEVSYPKVLEWIYSIPANQRCTFYDMLLIK